MRSLFKRPEVQFAAIIRTIKNELYGNSIRRNKVPEAVRANAAVFIFGISPNGFRTRTAISELFNVFELLFYCLAVSYFFPAFM